MEASKLQTRLKVALLSLPPRTQAVLDFFFSSSGRSSFAPSGEDIADVAIFDFDTLESRQHWEAFRARSGRPGIALSTQPQQLEGALWVQKPVTPAALLAAAADLRAGRTGGAAADPAPTAASAPAPQWQEVTPSPVAAPEPMPEPVPEPVAVPAPAPAPVPEVAAAPVPPAVPAPPVAPVRPASPEPAARPGGLGGLLRRIFGGRSPAPAPAPVVPAPTPAPAVRPAAVPAAAPVAVAPAPAPVPEVAAAPVPPAVPAPPVAPVRPASPEPAARPGGLGGLLRRIFGGRSPAPAPAPVVPAPTPAPAVRPAAVPAAAPVAVAPAASVPEAPAVPVAAPSAEPVLESVAPAAPAPAPAAAPSQPARRPAAAAPVAKAPAAKAPAPAAPVPAPAPVARKEPEKPAVGAPAFDASGQRRVRAEEQADEARYCGERGDLDAATLGSDASLRYDPAQHLVGVLKDAFQVSGKWQVPAHLESPAGRITVDGTTNLIYCEFSAEQFAALARAPIDKRPKTRAFSRQEFADLQETLTRTALVRRLDQVLWQTALETSAGRLPAGVDPAATVYLKSWPNLTRLHRTPHALRIAALWATRGASLLETAQTLKIAQRHVFAFYNAALALDLITEDGGQIRRLQRGGGKSKGNRGLLTRLFGWLNK